jgi:hypothetical protein
MDVFIMRVKGMKLTRVIFHRPVFGTVLGRGEISRRLKI